jgi:hypothetical protein
MLGGGEEMERRLRGRGVEVGGGEESGGRVREEATLNSISKFAINFGVWLVASCEPKIRGRNIVLHVMHAHMTREGIKYPTSLEKQENELRVFFSYLMSERAFSINICALLAFQA